MRLMTTSHPIARQHHVPGRTRNRVEDKVQSSIIDYVRLVVPESHIVAIPNAARREDGGNAGNAVPGLTPGVFDLCLLLPDGRVGFIEVKAPNGRLSKPQEAFRDVLIRFGTPHCIARSIDDVRAALADWRVETREVWS